MASLGSETSIGGGAGQMPTAIRKRGGWVGGGSFPCFTFLRVRGGTGGRATDVQLTGNTPREFEFEAVTQLLTAAADRQHPPHLAAAQGGPEPVRVCVGVCVCVCV